MHASTQAFTEHVFPLSHAIGVDQSVHPDAPFAHVWMFAPEHWLVPTVHLSVQLAAQLPALHTSVPGQATGSE